MNSWSMRVAVDRNTVVAIIIMLWGHWGDAMFMTTRLQTGSRQGEVASPHYVLSSP